MARTSASAQKHSRAFALPETRQARIAPRLSETAIDAAYSAACGVFFVTEIAGLSLPSALASVARTPLP